MSGTSSQFVLPLGRPMIIIALLAVLVAPHQAALVKECPQEIVNHEIELISVRRNRSTDDRKFIDLGNIDAAPDSRPSRGFKTDRFVARTSQRDRMNGFGGYLLT